MKYIGVKHYFLNLTFSTITSELFVLQQRIWQLTSSCFIRGDESRIPSFAHKKTNFKIGPFAKFGILDQVRSKLVILGVIRFGATIQTIWYPFPSSIAFGWKVIGKRVISLQGYHGPCRKFTWTEVTKIKKIRKISYVGIHCIYVLHPERLEIFGLKLCSQHDL